MICCAQPGQCILCEPVANPNSSSIAPNRPTFAQRWERGRFRAAPNVPIFAICATNQALVTVLCTFCQLARLNHGTAETKTLLRRPHEPLYPKKRNRVSRPRVFSPMNSRVPELLLFYCSHTRTALAQNVVDMMMLTWGWHGDKSGHSSLTRKLTRKFSSKFRLVNGCVSVS